ncbi:Sec-independent protein translocase subunit TatA [Actinomycetospora chibensis]|uniref:Sec-independent protein translocase protein TatA n=1 Tax=Actinomycetospora chibensis TaxID=663606 RepID=A0ABV9RDW9_9PSEU|nr:Sec-independent protein translocase subunit TatA [Actinomycetospora chibensis]MDD7926656.1 Sec-independent protein translocase subunit TatA [Actinomycetospora chibensis]
MTGALSPTHWLVILVVVLLLFGAKRMPDAARGIGRSLRIFKAETKALTDDGESSSPAEASAGAPAAVETGSARRAGTTPSADAAPARSTDASTV